MGVEYRLDDEATEYAIQELRLLDLEERVAALEEIAGFRPPHPGRPIYMRVLQLELAYDC